MLRRVGRASESLSAALFVLQLAEGPAQDHNVNQKARPGRQPDLKREERIEEFAELGLKPPKQEVS